MPRCPVCSTQSGEYARGVDAQYRVYKCAGCGLEYTMPVPDDSMLKSFYWHYHDVRADDQIVMRNARRNLEKLQPYGINAESRILDFGCGKGVFIEAAGENCWGLELSEMGTHERVRTSLDELPFERFDAITLWGVLEHLNRIVPTMESLVDRLAQGGVLVLTTVNAEGPIPYYFKPPEHLTYWTQRSFEVLAERLGMEIVAYTPYVMEQFGSIYFERVLSRTPEAYKKAVLDAVKGLIPTIVEVPTNEIFVVMKRK